MRWETVTPVGPEHVLDVQRLFAQAWWTQSRSADGIGEMLQGSQVSVGLVESQQGRMVAFARAVTDGIYKALVMDVIVDEEHRGSRLGHQLVEILLETPPMSSVEEVELYCHPRHAAFYGELGFAVPDDTILMRRPSAQRPQTIDPPLEDETG